MNEDTFTIDESGNPKISDNGAVAGATAAFSAGKDLSDVVNEQIKDPNFAPSDVIGIQDVSRYSARDWENVRDSFYDGRSSSGEIAKNAAKQFAYNFMTLGDKAEIALGAIANLSSDGLLGDEMIEQGRIALDSKLSTISDIAALPKDSESLVSLVTQGAMSMTEMAVTGLLTNGIMPLIEISTDSLGTGTYNNVKKYYDENGSLNGYKTGAFDLSIDVSNAVGQSIIEHKLGLGGKFINRMLSRTSGAFLKEFAGGFAQEFTQGALGDVAEVIKGNEDISILEKNLKNYVVSGMIGGVMQGAMGSAVYKYNHIKAVDSVVDFAVINGAENTPELRSKAEQMIVDEEKELTPDYWNEMAQLLDANNNRGKLKDTIVAKLTESVRKRSNMADDDELDLEDIQDISDQSTLLMREAVRLQWEKNLPISDSFLYDIQVNDDGSISLPALESVGTKNREDIDALKAKQTELEEQLKIKQMDLENQKAERSKISQIDKSLKELEGQAKRLQAKKQARIKLEENVDAWWNKSLRLREIKMAKKNSVIGNKLGSKQETLFQSDAINSENFKKWFGDSKVVDKDGKPLVVYHGGTASTEFSNRYFNSGSGDGGWLGKGFYFTPDYDYAQSYVDNDESKQLLEVFVSANNPYIIQNSLENGSYSTQPDLLKNKLGAKNNSEVQKVLKEQGYDSIILKDYEDEGAGIIEIVAFEPNQIKSVNNQGTFSPETGNIYKQSGLSTKANRGSFDSITKKIILNKKSDVSSTIHEFMHAFTQAYFMFQRSGQSSRTFQQNWGAVERWAGIQSSDKFIDRAASEKLARAYEQWVMEGGKGAPDSLKSLFTRLSAKLTDIYDDYKLGYFKDVGKMSPALETWFANNEKLYLLMNNREPDELEKKREQIIAESKVEMVRQGTADQQTQALNNQVEKNADANGMVGVSDQNAYSDQANNPIIEMKQQKLDIIQKTNPAPNNNLTWIRNIDDVKTFDEAMQDEESFAYPDFTIKDAGKALQSGYIKIYSSNDIKNGNFVSPSKMQAQDYAGNKSVKESILPITDIAWINADEGQVAISEDDKFNTKKRRERGISKAVRKSTEEQTGVELEKSMYTQRNVKKAVLTAPEFVQANPDQSYEIIMGAPEVGGYRREELFAAYLDYAQSEITNGNMEYVYKLQNVINSDMAKKRTEEGQRNAALRRYDNNVVRIDETLRELQQVSESEKAIVQSELSELEMSIQKTDKSINIDEVLKEVECQ